MVDTLGLLLVVERAIAWLGRCRRLSEDYEYNTTSSETWIKIAAIQQMSRRLRPEAHNRQPTFKYPKKRKESSLISWASFPNSL